MGYPDIGNACSRSGKLTNGSGRREMRKIECEPGKLSNKSGRGKDDRKVFTGLSGVVN